MMGTTLNPPLDILFLCRLPVQAVCPSIAQQSIHIVTKEKAEHVDKKYDYQYDGHHSMLMKGL